ncbi:MAG: sigma-70 family RNA polymerase sigma factor, partial [Bacteroidales bacterium]|nr:sigma-70 family RNA polymerase sigma factor [Bacteroidales bacterium]
HIAGRLIGRQDDLEDLCQDVFVKVFKKLPSFRSDSKLSTWIATIAYREALNHINKKKIVTEEFKPEILPLGYESCSKINPENISIKEEQKQLLLKSIRCLPEKYKTILNMFYLEEFSIKEIEEITNMPEGTIKNYIFRARTLLKEELLKQHNFKEVNYENR